MAKRNRLSPPRARARTVRPRHQDGRMNKTEAAYAKRLEVERFAGRVALWRFEELKLRIADRTWYTPDFVVLDKEGHLELHEVKGGHWEDDARVKVKAVAEAYPEFRVVAVTKVPKKDGGGWKEEVFPSSRRAER